MEKFKIMKKLKLLLFSCVFISIVSCTKEDDEICQFTYQTSDGHNNYRDVTIDYPCHLGPPATSPVNTIN